MNENVKREFFEKITCPNFGIYEVTKRKKNGEYLSDIVEDHWQTFQEGWDCAIEYLKNKTVSTNSDKYTDIVSNGKNDIR